MFKPSTLAVLKKHSWLYYQNKEDQVEDKQKKINKSQTWIRTLNSATNAFSHLSLLASKLPPDKFIQVFNLPNISLLLKSMMVFKTEEHLPEATRNPDLRITEFIVQFGLDIMIKEYRRLSWYTPEIAQLTLDHLLKTKAICHDISINAETSKLEIEASQNQRRYLFTWERISKEDRLRFQNFVFGLIENRFINKKNNFTQTVEIKYFSIGIGGLEALITKQGINLEENDLDPMDIEEGMIDFELNIVNSTAILTIRFLNETIKKTLEMEYRNDDYYFYD